MAGYLFSNYSMPLAGEFLDPSQALYRPGLIAIQESPSRKGQPAARVNLVPGNPQVDYSVVYVTASQTPGQAGKPPSNVVSVAEAPPVGAPVLTGAQGTLPEEVE